MTMTVIFDVDNEYLCHMSRYNHFNLKICYVNKKSSIAYSHQGLTIVSPSINRLQLLWLLNNDL